MANKIIKKHFFIGLTVGLIILVIMASGAMMVGYGGKGFIKPGKNATNISNASKTPIPKCYDTDGGKNYFLKGTATYNNKAYTDYCELINATNTTVTTTLTEYFCATNNKVDAEYIQCIDYNSTKCIDGACV